MQFLSSNGVPYTILDKPDWQPIETAPKDGKWLLGFYRGKCIIYRWSQRQFDKCGNGWDFTANGLHSPTHWMPLPAPPNTD